MKKFLIIVLFFCFCLTGCGKNNSINNENINNSYTLSRIIDNENNINNPKTNNVEINNSIDNTILETEIASFSTKIYTPNDEARQNNIRITCSKLDGTIVRAR